MDAKMIAHGILDGLSGIPHGMYLGVVRTWEDLGVTGNRENIEIRRRQNVFS